MTRCPNCRGEFDEGAFYSGRCPYCGSKLLSEKEKNDISTTISIAFKVFKNNFDTFFVFWLIPMVIGIAFYLLTFQLTTFPTEQEIETGAEVIAILRNTFLILIPSSLGLSLIQYLFAGGVIGMTKEAFEKRFTSMSTGFSTIKKYPLMIMGTAFVYTLVVSLGTCLCIIPGVLFCYWWLFAMPIVVLEGVGIGDAFRKSKKFAKRNETLLFTIVLFLLIFGLSSIITSIVQVATGTFTFDGVMTLDALTVISSVLSTIINSIAIIFFTICLAVHYIRGREVLEERVDYFNTSPDEW